MANESVLRDSLNALRDIPIVGDVRGMGHFWAIELVRDQESKLTFEGPAAEWLLKDVLSAELWGRGMICRLDDRTEPIVQIAPPLVSRRARRSGRSPRSSARPSRSPPNG